MSAPDAIPEDVLAAAQRWMYAPVADDFCNSLHSFIAPLPERSARVLAYAILAERERCAQIAENNNSWPQEGAEIAEEIRGHGQ